MAGGKEQVNREIKYRAAEARDYQGVLDIDKNFINGLDYIEATYYNWLHSPRYYMYVAEHDGKVVAFQAKYVSSDGRSYTGMSARVMQPYRQSGIHKHLLVYAQADLKKKHPGLQTVMFTAGYGKFWKKNLPVDLARKKLSIRYMGAVMYTISRIALEEGLYHLSTHVPNDSAIRHCDSQDIARLTRNPERIFHVIDKQKKGVFLTGFGPLSLPTSVINLKEALAYNKIAVSYTGPQCNELESISFSSVINCKKAIRVEISIYVPDVGSAIAHIADQLKYVVDTTIHSRYIVCLLVEEPPVLSNFEGILTACFGDRTRSESDDIQKVISVRQALDFNSKL